MGDADVTASNWRLVEVGRVVLFTRGPNAGKLAAIVEIIDHKRVLVDGPAKDAKAVVPRHAISLSDLSLTPIVIAKLPRAAGHAALKAAWEKANVDDSWNNSTWAKNRASALKRRQLTDFERFKVMRLRKQARFEVRKTLAAAKAKA
ncbi:60S ribosomal protein L14-B [Elsinoe australis]|uniref:60S ribosomal protein L14 n=1 Tax=Elsinoe australis TaxID=40998 RepID=A0A2P7YEB9_9PEZI|nr:60S ribosomal protein L14 [Elsinoe australis]TKX18495.1 60S ribosomal protein L14-B [Elsinoe australis]